MKRVHIKVSGRVQGVFYRAHTQKKALELRLTGWVRNTPDGGVEITAEGEKEGLDALAKWCQMGPPAAMVNSVALKWQEATGEFKNFHIAY